MNILVLNGSPKGKYSITLQTVRYLQKLHPEHSFEFLNVGQTIKSLEKDFTPAKEALKMMGMPAGPLRLPLVPMLEENRVILRKALEDAGIL